MAGGPAFGRTLVACGNIAPPTIPLGAGPLGVAWVSGL